MNDEILTPDEAASLLKMSRRKLYELLKHEDGPPSLKIGHHRRFLREDVMRWLKEVAAGQR